MENQVNPRVIRYMNWLAGQESGNGTKMYGDWYDPKTGKIVTYDTGMPTSAGLFHWNNDKKPLGKDGIPAQFKRDAIAFGFDPNDFSLAAQKKVGYAKINDDFNKLGDFVQVDAKWNGAHIVNGRYVHNSQQRYNDLIKGTQGNVGNIVDDVFTTQTANAQDAAVQTNIQPTFEDRSVIDKVGGFAADIFARPIESAFKTPKDALLGLAYGIGQSAGQRIQGNKNVDIAGNIINATESAKQQPTITEMATGNPVVGRDLTTVKGVGQTAGDLIEAGLNAYGGAGTAGTKALKGALTRGLIVKGAKVGTGYGLGMGTAENLQKGADWSDKSTYGTLAKYTGGFGVFGGALGGLSKGGQVLGEKLMNRYGNEIGAVGNKLRRDIGINPLLETPEAKTALDKLKTAELSKTRQNVTELIQDAMSQGKNMTKATNILSNMDDDSFKIMQKIFAENPISKGNFTSNMKVNIAKQANIANELKNSVGKEMTSIADKLNMSGAKLPTSVLINKFDSLLKNGIPGVPADKLNVIREKAVGILNNPAYSKNGVINFSKLHDLGISGNSKFGADDVESLTRNLLGKSFKESINDPKIVKIFAPEQQQAINAYKDALSTFGRTADAEWLINNIGKATVKKNNLLGSAAGFLAAGATGSPTSVLGVLSYAGGKGLTGKLTEAASKTGLSKTVKSKLPATVMDDVVGGLKKKSSTALTNLDTMTAADKFKKAAGNRVQKTVKPVLKEIDNEIASLTNTGKQKVIQIGKNTASTAKKKLSDEIKSVSKKVKLPTIEF